MQDLVYTGTAPGQAARIRIGGREYRRGEVYTVTNQLADDLLRRGGFEHVDAEPVDDTTEED